MNENALIGNLPTTLGDIEHLKKLYANINQLSGVVPASLVALTQLTHLALSYNNFTGLPNFNPNIAMASGLYLTVVANQLDFGDLEPNFQGPGDFIFDYHSYGAQDISTGLDEIVLYNQGESLQLSVPIMGTQTQYRWQQIDPNDPDDWDDVPNAPNHHELTIENPESGSTYRCRLTNLWVYDNNPEDKIIYSHQFILELNNTVDANYVRVYTHSR